jgi:hypothetical protein
MHGQPTEGRFSASARLSSRPRRRPASGVGTLSPGKGKTRAAVGAMRLGVRAQAEQEHRRKREHKHLHEAPPFDALA